MAPPWAYAVSLLFAASASRSDGFPSGKDHFLRSLHLGHQRRLPLQHRAGEKHMHLTSLAWSFLLMVAVVHDMSLAPSSHCSVASN